MICVDKFVNNFRNALDLGIVCCYHVNMPDLCANNFHLKLKTSLELNSHIFIEYNTIFNDSNTDTISRLKLVVLDRISSFNGNIFNNHHIANLSQLLLLLSQHLSTNQICVIYIDKFDDLIDTDNSYNILSELRTAFDVCQNTIRAVLIVSDLKKLNSIYNDKSHPFYHFGSIITNTISYN